METFPDKDRALVGHAMGIVFKDDTPPVEQTQHLEEFCIPTW